ncbi:toxin secretion phage lysis holin [Limosilactobacillus coleohominis DSM 14060]|nr:toxin secretion phage lysis holin [Limosilactobacillus coleohominis DSM 14060]
MTYLLASQPFHQLYFNHFAGMEDNKLIWLFVWSVIIDIVTGFARSLVTHHTTSKKGTDGLIKHGVLLLVILTLYPMLDVNGFKSAGDAFVLFYFIYYLVSIFENWGQMGLPLPSWVKKYIYKLSDEYIQENSRKDEHKNE